MLKTRPESQLTHPRAREGAAATTARSPKDIRREPPPPAPTSQDGQPTGRTLRSGTVLPAVDPADTTRRRGNGRSDPGGSSAGGTHPPAPPPGVVAEAPPADRAEEDAGGGAGGAPDDRRLAPAIVPAADPGGDGGRPAPGGTHPAGGAAGGSRRSPGLTVQGLGRTASPLALARSPGRGSPYLRRRLDTPGRAHLSGPDRRPMAGGQGPASGLGGAAQRSLFEGPAGVPGDWSALALMGPLAQLMAQYGSNALWPAPVPPPPLPAAQLGPGVPGAGTAAGWIGAVPAAAAALAALLGGAPAPVAGRVGAPSVYAAGVDWSGNPSGNLPESGRDLERAGTAAVVPGSRGTPAAPTFAGTAGAWPGGGPTLEALRAAAAAAVGAAQGPSGGYDQAAGWAPPLSDNPLPLGASAAWDRGLDEQSYPDGRQRRGNAMFGAPYVDTQGLQARDLESLPALRDLQAPSKGIGGNAAQLAAQAVGLQVRKHSGALLRAQPKHDGPTHAPLMAEAILGAVLLSLGSAAPLAHTADAAVQILRGAAQQILRKLKAAMGGIMGDAFTEGLAKHVMAHWDDVLGELRTYASNYEANLFTISSKLAATLGGTELAEKALRYLEQDTRGLTDAQRG
ncbi:hypothetical protein PLESTM_000443900 [Pleodorina starrii]|nr:hypothetical protein PLESTM_000443900 [Pleodorina starrii]